MKATSRGDPGPVYSTSQGKPPAARGIPVCSSQNLVLDRPRAPCSWAGSYSGKLADPNPLCPFGASSASQYPLSGAWEPCRGLADVQGNDPALPVPVCTLLWAPTSCLAEAGFSWPLQRASLLSAGAQLAPPRPGNAWRPPQLGGDLGSRSPSPWFSPRSLFPAAAGVRLAFDSTWDL